VQAASVKAATTAAVQRVHVRVRGIATLPPHVSEDQTPSVWHWEDRIVSHPTRADDLDDVAARLDLLIAGGSDDDGNRTETTRD
jgi:hypothetical protein